MPPCIACGKHADTSVQDIKDKDKAVCAYSSLYNLQRGPRFLWEVPYFLVCTVLHILGSLGQHPASMYQCIT